MSEHAGNTRLALAATDVDFTVVGADQCELRTSAKKFALRATAEEIGRLEKVVTELLPRLHTSAPLPELLSAAELTEAEPYLDWLHEAGVLFYPLAKVGTDADRRLYSFLARRTESGDAAFREVKSHAFHLTGPDDLVGAWTEVFAAQGLSLGQEGDPGAISVRVTLSEEPRHSGDRPWVPVVVGPSSVRIGPWVAPGESACPDCLSRGDRTTTAAPPSSVAHTSWLSCQPGARAWVGGVLAHQALRALAPMGPHHPWGRVTTIDALRMEQSTHVAWRDPYCGTCAEPGPLTQEWTELA